MGVDLETIFDIEPPKETTEKEEKKENTSSVNIEAINKRLDKIDSKIKNLKIAKYCSVVAGLSIGIASVMDKRVDDTMLNATIASFLICFSPVAEYTLKQPLVQEKEVICQMYPETKKPKIKRLKRR